MDELDRILTDDEEIRPTAGFSNRVMRAVEEEANGMRGPIAFPWSRFLPGLVVNLVLLVAAVVWWRSEAQTAPLSSPAFPWAGDPQLQSVLWAALVLAGTTALVWALLRRAGNRRTFAVFLP